MSLARRLTCFGIVSVGSTLAFAGSTGCGGSVRSFDASSSSSSSGSSRSSSGAGGAGGASSSSISSSSSSSSPSQSSSSGTADAGPMATPATCAELAAGSPTPLGDGDYTLYVMGDAAKPWTAYCKDMATSPKDYLALSAVGANSNYSQYTAGGASPGTSVRTNYTKLHVVSNAGGLLVDIGDQTFATSTGSVSSSTTVTAMPYGVAADCSGGGSATGLGNIDLTGTRFGVAPSAFVQGGNDPGGVATYDGTGQVISLTGGGFCGWTVSAPDLFNPYNQVGGPHLPLTYL